MKKNQKIMVEREPYEKEGKSYFSYFVRGTVRGIEIKAQVSPTDIGGYTVLDIVFNGGNEAELVLKPYEIKDEKGNVVKGNTYFVRSVDENGEIYECKIKPFRDSGKSMLEMLTR